MSKTSVVVLGGGLAGLATACALADAGWSDVTVIEKAPSVGGLAGSFEHGGCQYPLGYHHICPRDHVLLSYLNHLEVLSTVRWRRPPLLFNIEGRFHRLDTPCGFLRFPMSTADKARFVHLMFRAFRKPSWSDWEGRSAADLVDAWGGPGVRRALFEYLTWAKFELPCEEVSGAWLGARLHAREGSLPLGYIPGVNWAKTLCDGLLALMTRLGVRVLTDATIQELQLGSNAIRVAELDDGRRISGDVFVNTMPTEVYCKLVPNDRTPHIGAVRYTALISAVCGTRQCFDPRSYWLVVASRQATASGIFTLNALNPSIGRSGENTINFVAHLRNRDRPLFKASDEELMSRFMSDCRRIFGYEIQLLWQKISRIPMYSPIFHPEYTNPPVRSTSLKNVFFAGNYRTFPSLVSTGTALASGLEAAGAILRHYGRDSPPGGTM